MRLNYFTLLVIGCLAGVFLSIIGFLSFAWLGSQYIDGTSLQWGMNTYWSVPARTAFTLFGFIPLYLGGVFTGIVFGVFLARRCANFLILLPSSSAVFTTTLGFNTVDWMLASTIGAETTGWSAWIIGRPDIVLNSWDFYLLLGILPLFFGGFLISLTIIASILSDDLF